MLAERVKEWTEEWKQQGRAEGKAEMLHSERMLLLRLVRRRFGEESAQTAAPFLDRIEDPTRLEDIGEWILDSSSVEELLARLENG